MANIKDLPGAGNNFRVSHVAGNFTKRFAGAVKYGSSLRNLADNKESILKVVKKNEGVIRLGKFDRLRRLKALKEVKKLEGVNLSKDDKREIKLLFKHLGERKKSEKVESVSKINKAEIARADDDTAAVIPHARVSRDANGNLSFNEIRKSSFSGGASKKLLNRSETRAAAARASINYDRMTKITGASGRNLQKDAFAKLHAVDPTKASSMAKEGNIKTNRSMDINTHPGVNLGQGGRGSGINLAL